jgi:lipoyl(octanoyl) transferase
MIQTFVFRHSERQPFTFLDLQQFQSERLRLQAPSLIFAELPPTLTLGNRQDPADFSAFQGPELAVLAGDRGGLETWHGPGQWVGFVVMPLEQLAGPGLGVKRAVMAILESLLPVIQRFEPAAKIETEARLGIWSAQGKLVSIGIRVKRRIHQSIHQPWVTSGFALNVVPNPASFKGISPCGIENARPDFLFLNRIAGSDWAAEFERLPEFMAAALNKNVKKSTV